MTASQEAFKRISVEEAKQMLDTGDSVMVDVRNLDEWQSGHVSGAVHVPVDDILARVDELPDDKNFNIYKYIDLRYKDQIVVKERRV